LKHVQKRLRKIQSERLRDVEISLLAEDAVLGIIRGRDFTKEIEGSDVIVCAGLFDYLSDRVASKLIDALLQKLRPGGTLYIGNVSSAIPDVFTMSYFMEWNLVLRDERQLLNLVSEQARHEFNLKCEVVSEALGLNLFLKVKKE
jgi:extracellular factor (EF) 3-hydroxypalmitic acid methyl ester biosynthesis protein